MVLAASVAHVGTVVDMHAVTYITVVKLMHARFTYTNYHYITTISMLLPSHKHYFNYQTTLQVQKVKKWGRVGLEEHDAGTEVTKRSKTRLSGI